MSFLIEFIGGFLKPEMFRKQIGSIIRHLLTYSSGFLTLLGLSQDQIDLFGVAVEPVLMAVAMYALAQAWSFIEKIQKEDK